MTLVVHTRLQVSEKQCTTPRERYIGVKHSLRGLSGGFSTLGAHRSRINILLTIKYLTSVSYRLSSGPVQNVIIPRQHTSDEKKSLRYYQFKIPYTSVPKGEHQRLPIEASVKLGRGRFIPLDVFFEVIPKISVSDKSTRAFSTLARRE